MYDRNKIPTKSTYHTIESSRHYITKYYNQSRPSFGVYGFISLLDRRGDGTGCGACGSEGGVCMLRPSKQQLMMTDEQMADCDALIKWVRDHTAIGQLMADIYAFYGVPSSLWPASFGVTTSTRQRAAAAASTTTTTAASTSSTTATATTTPVTSS
jgi:hypothetical protein